MDAFLQGQIPHKVDPFFCLHRRPDEEEIIDSCRARETRWDQQQPCTLAGRDKLREVSWHVVAWSGDRGLQGHGLRQQRGLTLRDHEGRPGQPLLRCGSQGPAPGGPRAGRRASRPDHPIRRSACDLGCGERGLSGRVRHGQRRQCEARPPDERLCWPAC